MKRITFLIFAMLVAVLWQPMLHAEHDEKGMMEGKNGKGMCCKMKGMHAMMMRKSVTATSDGGIVIVAGNKITKYDKDLNVVKEVENKMDMEAMMGKCPMKKDKKMGEAAATETAPAATPVADEVDHAAHH